MKKIGIMGGTFNPIHLGHLFLAENAYEQLGLDKILFMPSKNPPHKDKPDQVTMQERVEMISLAVQKNPHFELSTTELEREGTTYTADTLTYLSEMNPDTHYFFLVGADSLLSMQQWKDPQTIFRFCTVVAAGRDNIDSSLLKQQVEMLKKTYRASIQLIHMPTIQIASEIIRSKIAAGSSVRYYLPEAVYEYIMNNRLYFSQPEELG